MKKHALFISGLCLFALLVASVLAVAQEDVSGSKDHPLFMRMPNFYIDDYEYKEFDEAVVKALITKYGVSQSHLNPYGVGPLAPVASNETEEGRALNRRVELVKE
jgi:hypothetical protein